MRLNYLVTGTGRCGTVFMARFLTSLGIPCGHEAVFDWKGEEWVLKRLSGKLAIETSFTSTHSQTDEGWAKQDPWLDDPQKIVAESSYMAAPFLDRHYLADCALIHLVRNPINVVQSFTNHIHYFADSFPQNCYEAFIYKHVPELAAKMPRFDRAALYYIRWNQLIDTASVALFHRIEDGPTALLAFLNKTGPHFSDSTVNSFAKPNPEPFNVHRLESKLIKNEFIQMMRRYGYTVFDMIPML